MKDKLLELINTKKEMLESIELEANKDVSALDDMIVELQEKRAKLISTARASAQVLSIQLGVLNELLGDEEEE